VSDSGSPNTGGSSDFNPDTAEARIAKALAHPLRARILQRLGERVASPGDLAVELNAPLGVVSYHVRMLRDYDCIELVRTEPRRGALQHFYRATARPNFGDYQWRSLPSPLRRELAGEKIQGVFDDLATASEAGTLTDEETVIVRQLLELDERGRKKLNGLLAKFQERALAIAAESEARRADGGSSEVSQTELALFHFKRS
jgi:DNA-binding transcriptional ArsR family regulator